MDDPVQVVLDRIDALDAKLDLVMASNDANQASNDRKAKNRVRFLVAYCTVAVLLVTLAGLGYIRSDSITRCQRRADQAMAIQSAFHTDHVKFRQGLVDGFGDTPDVRRVVAAVEAGQDEAERQLAEDFPVPKCRDFWP